MLLETSKLALEALLRNRLRSALTMLGIVIGVGAVIAMVSVGHGATAAVAANIAKLGPNLVTLTAGQTLRGGGGSSRLAMPFDMDDVAALQREVRAVRTAAPYSAATLRVTSGKRNWLASIVGTENAYFRARIWPLSSGRLFNGHELHTGKTVCVIGATVHDQVFPDGDGLGAMMRVGSVPCTVVGVLAKRGRSAADGDEDNVVALPFRAFERRIQGSPDVHSIVMEVDAAHDAARTRAQIVGLMRERRALAAGEREDFSVLDMRQISMAMSATTATMTSLLAAIAAVSLVVGGIGIMNIMLVSVVERTREIGVRLAIGASPRQVMAQFLIEAVVLTLTGGVAGIVVGVAVAGMVTTAAGVPFVVDPSVVMLALSVSLLVGLVFGYGPAIRAARLDPVEALRTA